MLSDLSYTTDFLSNRITKVDEVSPIIIWDENESLKFIKQPTLQYQSQNTQFQPISEGMCSYSNNCQSRDHDRLQFVDYIRTTTSSFENEELGLENVAHRHAYHAASEIQSSALVPKSGNREELSTPVTITPLETPVVLNTPTYIYGQMSEMLTTLDPVGRCGIQHDRSGNGLINIAVEGSPISTAAARLDFTPSSDLHPFAFASNSVGIPQSGNGDNMVGVNVSSPFNPNFWFDDSEQVSVEHGYEDQMNSVQQLHSTHSDTAHSDESVTLVMENLSREVIEDVYLACETPSEVEITQYVQDASTGAEALSGKLVEETTEIKRDRLTGKFKQNSTEHSSSSEKLCKVCNDRAVNHNFGQLTCESCKAFFRRNAHKDLTCTLKAGEHEITPTTRRECPACRLKKCFRVGMRPDLIQVRKKDGSKPRWLEKVPSAAIVHEKHLQASDANIWTSAMDPTFRTGSKSDNNNERTAKQKQISKDCREDVCSTDSGSCLSIEAVPITSDTNSTTLGGKRSKPGTVGAIDLMEIGPAAESVFHELSVDASRNSSLTEGLTSAISDSGNHTIGLYPNADGLVQTNQIDGMVTVDAGKSQSVLFHPLVTVSMPTILTGVNNSQSHNSHAERTLVDPSVSCSLTNSHISPSRKLGNLNGFEDYVLLTNTPQLIVPTNLVTIAPASTINQSPLDSISVQPIHRHFGIDMNAVEVCPSQAKNPQFHYTTYNKFPQEGPTHTISSNNVVIGGPAGGIAQSLITPLWSPQANSILSNGIIQVATQTEHAAQTLVSSMPKCVLATSIQPITRAPLMNTTDHVTPASFKQLGMGGATSFRLSVQNAPSSINSLTLTAVLPSVTSFPTRFTSHTNNISHEPNLFTPTNSNSQMITENLITSPAVPSVVTSSSSFLLTQTSTHQASYIGVVSTPMNWTTNNPTINMVSPSAYSNMAPNSVENRERLDSVPPVAADFHEMQWESVPATEKSQLNNVFSETKVASDSVLKVPVDVINSSHDTLTISCNLDDVSTAWTAMWREGEFPNPENVNLHINTEAECSLPWRLILTNIWDDILLRRISVFAVALFGPLCNANVEARQLTEKTQISDIFRSAWSDDKVCNSTSTESQVAEVPDDNRTYSSIGPSLTWHDLLWLAKHRFADCVPVLLIGCLLHAENKDTGVQFPNFLPTHHGSDQFLLGCSSKYPCNQPSVCPTEEKRDVNKACSKYSKSKQEEFKDRGELESPQTRGKKADTMVELRCNPGGSVLLSLTRLSHCLAQLPATTVGPVAQGQPEHQVAYPILQYLDAYIAQFGNFLAHQPLLMGAFLALKLTDPHFIEQANCATGLDTLKPLVPPADGVTERRERLRKLHSHFVHVFSEAADTVALSASRQLTSQPNEEFLNNAEIHPQEMAAANSRRAMLQDFLAWSRQFDAAWHEFQSDTWHQAVAANRQAESENKFLHIAQGLNALFGHNNSSDPSNSLSDKSDTEDGTNGLLQLLLDAKAELCFGLQSAR